MAEKKELFWKMTWFVILKGIVKCEACKVSYASWIYYTDIHCQNLPGDAPCSVTVITVLPPNSDKQTEARGVGLPLCERALLRCLLTADTLLCTAGPLARMPTNLNFSLILPVQLVWSILWGSDFWHMCLLPQITCDNYIFLQTVVPRAREDSDVPPGEHLAIPAHFWYQSVGLEEDTKHGIKQQVGLRSQTFSLEWKSVLQVLWCLQVKRRASRWDFPLLGCSLSRWWTTWWTLSPTNVFSCAENILGSYSHHR